MHHPEIDPSLRAAEPAPESLADGFSPPADATPRPAADHDEAQAAEARLPPQSPF